MYTVLLWKFSAVCVPCHNSDVFCNYFNWLKFFAQAISLVCHTSSLPWLLCRVNIHAMFHAFDWMKRLYLALQKLWSCAIDFRLPDSFSWSPLFHVWAKSIKQSCEMWSIENVMFWQELDAKHKYYSHIRCNIYISLFLQVINL